MNSALDFGDIPLQGLGSQEYRSETAFRFAGILLLDHGAVDAPTVHGLLERLHEALA